jgi:ferredoxin-NADP reductase
MEHTVKIKSIETLTHDVLQIVTEKPLNYTFSAGQATDVSVNKIGWKDEKRAFTFTSLPHYDYIEFIIKTYPPHNGVTNQFLQLKKDDELILHDVFGDISYKGEGMFIAGGAGITPFVSIFRHLQLKNEIGNNKLIFANKTKEDIILEEELESLLGKNFINILSDEKVDGFANGYITENFLKGNIDDLDKNFYVCGPPPMMDAIEKMLMNLGVDRKLIVKESF